GARRTTAGRQLVPARAALPQRDQDRHSRPSDPDDRRGLRDQSTAPSRVDREASRELLIASSPRRGSPFFATTMQNMQPELLYLVHGDPADLAESLAGMRAADVAEALNELPPPAAAKVMAVLPFDLAAQAFDEPELDRRYEIVAAMNEDAALELIEAMSADQRADLFRELAPKTREPLLAGLEPETRRTLEMLLRYPRESAGGIMTTEFLSVPSDWSVAQTLNYIHDVARTKETVYAIYVLDDEDHLVRVVSLRQLLISDPRSAVREVGDRRAPLTAKPDTDREEVARMIAKYNLLALPVVDDERHVLGIVTVDDVIDAIVHEQTEDVQKFGGVEALEAPYMEVGFGQMIRKRAPWLCALF